MSDSRASLEARLELAEAEVVSLRAALSVSSLLPSPSTVPNSCASPSTVLNSCALSASDASLYTRQMLCPAFTGASQRVLRRLRIVLVGAGGLGCPAALYLARMGVGSLTIIDDDTVSLSDLPRCVAFNAADVGTGKATALVRALERGGGGGGTTVLKAIKARFSASQAPTLLVGAHVVVDATDNARARYALNDACALARETLNAVDKSIPLVSGAALGTDGQVSVWWRGEGGCLRCTFPIPPPRAARPACADSGVLGPVTGAIGALMALEVMKLAARWARGEGAPPRWSASDDTLWPSEEDNSSSTTTTATTMMPPPKPTLGAPLVGKLLVLDGSEAKVRTLRLAGRSSSCAICGGADTLAMIKTLAAADEWAITEALDDGEALAGPNPTESRAIERHDFALPLIKLNPFLLDVRSSLQRDADAAGAAAAWMHIPLTVLNAERASKLVADANGRPFLALCRRGVDADLAVNILLSAGAKAAVGLDLRAAALLQLSAPKPY